MRKVVVIVAAMLFGVPSIAAAGARLLPETDLTLRAPLIRGSEVPRHRAHRPFHHGAIPGLLIPAEIVYAPIEDAADQRPETAMPVEAPMPPPPPVAEPKMLLPPAPAVPQPAGARTIVIQRGDDIEVVTLPPGTPAR